MKKLFHLLLIVATIVSGCVTELSRPCPGDGAPIDIAIRFGTHEATDVQVYTKSTLGLAPESTVFNLFVFVFDEDGNKIYNKFFNSDNLSTVGTSTLPDWWEVTNNDPISGNVTKTSGTIHLKTQNLTNCTIAAIANIDAEMVNISPEQLGTVNNKSELLELTATMNQLIVSRSGYFPMSDIKEHVDISTLSPTYTGTAPSLHLRRLDAKIRFFVQVEPGSGVRAFTPLKWQVMNLPTKAYVLERGNYNSSGPFTDATGASADDYFNTLPNNFETQSLYKTATGETVDYSGTTNNPIIVHGFSFYMLENRKEPTSTPAGGWEFIERDRMNHDGSDSFTYAPARSTYVIITGQVEMDITNPNLSGNDLTLSGEVQYILHLGHFFEDDVTTQWDDFKIFRNHTYTYHIYIQSVEDVRYEVDVNYDDEGNPTGIIDEKEPGATGKVVVAREEVLLCDAHYCSRVIDFHADNIVSNELTWYVQTPFNPDGAKPYVLPDGTELTSEIDCKWVEFRVNDLLESGLYDNHRQLYHPNKTMDVTTLVKFLREQKELLDNGDPNVFDNDDRPKISVTAFVNEYYYDKNPITKEYDPDLWKQFVNQPMRQLHILSDVKVSADGESTEIGSSFTIQQQSIQTIYNVNKNDLHSAWGFEHRDDKYESGERMTYFNGSVAPGGDTDRGNTHTTNGRLNSAKEWNLVDKNGNNIRMGADGDPLSRWDNYLVLNARNEDGLMRHDNIGGNHQYKYLRWSCMSRNRDNNGNGIIDEDEIRWYLAASNQVIGIFLGDYGIDRDSRLYQRSLVEQLSDERNVWRQHVVASTRNSGNNNSNQKARVVWAEEGLTGSDISYYSQSDGSTDYYNVRCVRNLGHDPNSTSPVSKDFTYAPLRDEPENIIVVERLKMTDQDREITEAYPSGSWTKDVCYVFDCSNINEASLRYFTDRELVSHDETHEAACLYKKFMVASKSFSETRRVPSGKIKGKEVQYIKQMNEYLDENIEENPFCPPGYRLPNVREDAVIWSFIPESDRTSFLSGIMNHSRTHWSFGEDGVSNKHLTNKSWGWSISSAKIIMANVSRSDQKTSCLRCVKDIKVQ